MYNIDSETGENLLVWLKYKIFEIHTISVSKLLWFKLPSSYEDWFSFTGLVNSNPMKITHNYLKANIFTCCLVSIQL